MTSTPPRVLSGIQPTADAFHLGNLIGALRAWVAMQETHECYYVVVDQHAITVDHDPALLRTRTLTSFAQLLAIGVDPSRSALFVQSQVPEHNQLAWVLECLTGYGEANRMTQFKDKSAKGERVSVGLLTYPILQAADILVYQADAVPVGEDQRQHLELTRDLAQRFNGRFGETFTVPEPFITKETARVLDLQDPTSKMSKSAPAGAVWLLDDDDVIVRKLKTAVTDSGREITYDPVGKPGVSNLLAIQHALTGRAVDDLVASYSGAGYGALKADTADVVIAEVAPIRDSVRAILSDPAELERLMGAGAARARETASRTVARVYERVGFMPVG